MSEPYDLLLEKYAALVVRVGVNVQPGQEVVINALPEQADAARAVAAEAYRVGASRVGINYDDPLPAAARRSSTPPRSSSARPRSTRSPRCAAGTTAGRRSSASPATRTRR